MGSKISFDSLNPTEFEEFCFELLKALGFENVDWRKGTGYSTSPSDSGRDIECTLPIRDVDSTIYNERWFVECKHQRKGIPPNEIQGILSWANAERPDKALIITSGFLSNSCKNYIKDYVTNSKPPFMIRCWESKKLEELARAHSLLLVEYGLSDELEFVKIMHPLHLQYISQPYRRNSLDFFFSIIDEFNPRRRDAFLQSVYYYSVMKWSLRKPVTGKERLRHLFIDQPDYDSFKKRCYSLVQDISESFLVKSIVSHTLGCLFFHGDKTRIDAMKEANQFLLESQKEKLEQAKDEEKTELSELIRQLESRIADLPARTEESYSLYISFCEEVVSKLISEPIKPVTDKILKQLDDFLKC